MSKLTQIISPQFFDMKIGRDSSFPSHSGTFRLSPYQKQSKDERYSAPATH